MPSAAVALSLLLLLSASTRAALPQSGARLLDVPYLSQTRALCGGAAAAMVLRYWGERGVYAEDFRDLVDPEKEGIPTEVLTDAIQKRGWWAAPFRGSPELAPRRIAEGHPLVVLLEEGPERYHYVVLIGSLPGRVVLHDPARAPYRLVQEEAFYASWAAAKFWALLILPAQTDEPAPDRPREASSSTGSGCSGMVDEAVRVARKGDLPTAEELLTASTEACPHSSAPLRELAGIRFLQSRWEEADELSQQAVDRDPEDDHAWRILGASRFLRDDAEGALRAWNRLDEPRVDLVRVDGLTRTRYEVAAQALDFAPGALLTPETLGLARRRLSALPVAVGSRVTYRPLTRGMAEVESSIMERPLWPGRTELLAAAMDAAFEREISLNLASPSGGGELWSGSWRWWQERPKVSMALSVPRPWGLPGIWQVEGSWERQTYGAAAVSRDVVVREDRRRTSLSITDWRSVHSRWDFLTGLDHWKERGRYAFFGGGLERRLASDRAALRVDGIGWMGLNPSNAFGTASVSSSWRLSATHDSLVARGGVQVATSAAPLDLWPGAGAGHARPPLLRAHPLLEDGVVRGEAFGRTLMHGGLESHTWFATTGLLRFGVGLFADVGKAWRTLSHEATALHVDIGAGLRLKPIGDRRTLRIDAAWGMRDGEFAVSAGWELPWPGWR